jgi:hypothetical protein
MIYGLWGLIFLLVGLEVGFDLHIFAGLFDAEVDASERSLAFRFPKLLLEVVSKLGGLLLNFFLSGGIGNEGQL